MSPSLSPATRSRVANIFNENLRRAIAARGINQKQLSAMTEISENGISNVLGGTRAIRFETLEALCAALDVSPGELFEDAATREV